MEKINVALADDHIVVANGLKLLLSSKDDLNVLPECKSGSEVLCLLDKGYHIDVLITDINMPDMDGLTLAKEIKRVSPHTKIIFLSLSGEMHHVRNAFSEGASAYLVKNANIEELFIAIDFAVKAKVFVGQELTEKLIGKLLLHQNDEFIADPIDFTSRELEVLDCIAQGMTNLEISEKLFLSKRTVEGHRQSLLTKTKSRNTATLIRQAVKRGLIN